jgi:hypothetical protein
MDELDLLKQDWKRQEKTLPHVDKDEIRAMMHKRSTSIVKWIFIISIAEFLFWLILESLSNFEDTEGMIKAIGIETFINVSTVLNYAMIFIFITLFFINFKKIKTNDSIKGLMKNIIKTRRTVKIYVWYNIIFFSVFFLIGGFLAIDQFTNGEEMKVKIISNAIFIVVFVVVLLFLIGFYRLLYGILTRRLYKNYQALRKLELKE